MKKIQDHIQGALTRLSKESQSEPTTKDAVNELWTAKLFKRFQTMYGFKWTKAIEGIEAEAVKTWTEILEGLNSDQIKAGLAKCEDWPPSAPEFKRFCLGKAKNEHGLNYVPEIYRAETKIFTAKKFRLDFENDKKRLENKSNEKSVL